MKTSPVVSSSSSVKTFLRKVRFQRAKAFLGVVSVLLLLTGKPASAQTTYSWTSSTTGGTWTTAGNWTPTSGTGTTFPSATGDTAVLGNATANRSGTANAIILGTTESISTLTFNETSGFTNELIVGGAATTNLTVANTLALGGSGVTGTELLYLDGIDTGYNTHTPSYIGSINVGAHGVLELGADASTRVPTVTGNVEVMSGGILNADQGVTGASGGISTAPAINGNLTFDSGSTLNISSQNSGNVSPLTGEGVYDTRFTVNGNLTVNTGATITVAHATGTTTTNELYFSGSGAQTAILDAGVIGTSSGVLTNLNGLIYNGSSTVLNTWTIESDDALPLVNFQDGAITSNTVGLTIGTVTPGGTLSVAGISFSVPKTSAINNPKAGTAEITLSSNVTLTGGSNYNPAVDATGSTFITNLQSYTLDSTDHGNFYASTNIYNWIYEGTAGGTIKDDYFTLTGGGGEVAIQGAITLYATGDSGGNSSTDVNNLNNAGTTAGNTIDAASTFEFAGTSAGSTENFLNSSRAIGNLVVGTGTGTPILGISAGLTVGGGITLNNGSVLDLAGQNVTEIHGSDAIAGGLNGSGTIVNGANNNTGNFTNAILTLDTTDAAGGNATYSGIIEDDVAGAGTVGVTITGTAGTSQTFSGNSSYTGGTIVGSTSTTASAGTAATLNVTGSLASGGALSVGAGATFALGEAAGGTSYKNQTVATLNLYSGEAYTSGGIGSQAQLSFAVSATGNDSLTSTGAFILSTGMTFALNVTVNSATSTDEQLMEWSTSGGSNVTSTSQIDLILNGNNLGVGSSDLLLTTSGGNEILELTPAAVPEPRIWGLMLAGLMLVGGYQLRRARLKA
jgi:hypothetical protein